MSRRKRNNKGSWTEFFLFVMIVLCVYFILSLFGSSLAGESGRNLGRTIRASLGGAVIVLLLFWLYLSAALFMKFRVPLLPRQILGTLQLYISFAFMLGLLKEAGFNAEATLLVPGALGHGLARFFVLNIGTFITLILVIGSFILSAYLYGARILRVSLPELPSLRDIKIPLKRFKRFKRFRREREHESDDTQPARKRRRRESEYAEDSPEQILFTRNVNLPEGESEDEDFHTKGDLSADFYLGSIDLPQFQNAKTESESSPEPEPEQSDEKTEPQNPVEVFDNLLAILDTAPSVESRRKASNLTPSRRIRRPLQKLSSDDESESQELTGDSNLLVPVEIFGPAPKLAMSNDTLKLSDSSEQGKTIISTLKEFKVNASIADTVEGASVIQYKLELSPGTKVSDVASLDGELAMALAVMSVRIEAPIPGTRYAGIEVPRRDRKTVTLRSIIESDEFKSNTARLPLAMGVQTDGEIYVHGLEDMPHMIIAGTKGSGKSMFIHSCIMSMCSVRKPEELKLILIDPGQIEFSVYDGLPHLLASPVNDSEEAFRALDWAVKEMETRTEDFADKRARNLEAYNRKLPKAKRLPEILIVINELADLIYSAEHDIENLIVRLAQKAGSCGIHMMIATERPSSEVITGPVKSNIPVCAAFTLSSKNESKSVLGTDDAFRLTGKGDMLFRNAGSSRLTRLQTGYISDERISDFTDYMIAHSGRPEFIDFN